MATSDLLLNPVRMRIIQAFLGGRTLTTGELAAELSDVPPASLYRQVAKLVNGGVLAIIRERRVRGTVERTYALRAHAAAIGRAELAAMSPEDHRQRFLAFAAALIADFDRYLDSGDIDLTRDMVSYRMTGLWLSDEELAECFRDIYNAVRSRQTNSPKPGRRLRVLRTILIPGGEPPGAAESDSTGHQPA